MRWGRMRSKSSSKNRGQIRAEMQCCGGGNAGGWKRGGAVVARRGRAPFSVQAAPAKSGANARRAGRAVGMKTRNTEQGQALRAGLQPHGAAGGPIMWQYIEECRQGAASRG